MQALAGSVLLARTYCTPDAEGSVDEEEQEKAPHPKGAVIACSVIDATVPQVHAQGDTRYPVDDCACRSVVMQQAKQQWQPIVLPGRFTLTAGILAAPGTVLEPPHLLDRNQLGTLSEASKPSMHEAQKIWYERQHSRPCTSKQHEFVLQQSPSSVEGCVC